MTISRDPAYLQVAAALRGELDRGEPAPGTDFASEREIASRFGVSRPTANKALARLAAEGRVLLRPGLPAAVAEAGLFHDMARLLSFDDEARAAGLDPSSRVLDFSLAEHPELGSALRLRRLRSARGTPAILEERFFPAGLCAALTPEMAAGSVYRALAELGLRPARAEQRALAVSPATEERELLGLPQGIACFRVLGRGFLEDGTTLWIEDTLFRGDRFEIRGSLRPLDHARED